MPKKVRILVEGEEDMHVISELLNMHNLTSMRALYKKKKPLQLLFSEEHNLDIIPVGDKAGVLEQFKLDIGSSTDVADAIGIVMDFDPPLENEPNNHDIAIKGIIDYFGLWNLQESFSVLEADGFIAVPSGVAPKIGVWLMPNNNDRGMLEDFLQQIIPEKRHGLLNYAGESARVAKLKFDAPYKDSHTAKAEIHTFLAWMNKPGEPFGTSFKNKSFNADDTLAKKFVEWIKRLFL